MSIAGLTILFYFIFGAFNQVGGVIGYVKSNSRASLIAGIIAGVLLESAAILMLLLPAQSWIGLTLGGLVSILLLSRFAPAFFRTKKVMPAGILTILGFISLVLTALNFTS